MMYKQIIVALVIIAAIGIIASIGAPVFASQFSTQFCSLPNSCTQHFQSGSSGFTQSGHVNNFGP